MARLDHLPLAIELEAWWMRIWTPGKILKRMHICFQRLAKGGPQRGRHATLRAALDGSRQLLQSWEQRALAQLSVLDVGFAPDAFEATVNLSGTPEATRVMDALQSLVSQSLVSRVRSDHFNLLLSIQQYADAQLDALGGHHNAPRRHWQHDASWGGAVLDRGTLTPGDHRRLLQLKGDAAPLSGDFATAEQHRTDLLALSGTHHNAMAESRAFRTRTSLQVDQAEGDKALACIQQALALHRAR